MCYIQHTDHRRVHTVSRIDGTSGSKVRALQCTQAPICKLGVRHNSCDCLLAYQNHVRTEQLWSKCHTHTSQRWLVKSIAIQKYESRTRNIFLHTSSYDCKAHDNLESGTRPGGGGSRGVPRSLRIPLNVRPHSTHSCVDPCSVSNSDYL